MNADSSVTLEKAVLGFMRARDLIAHGSKLLVGVSGGPDSVCLVHVLACHCREIAVELVLVHVDHQLRGAEAEADARYVVALGEKLGLPVVLERRDVAGYRREKRLSLEEAARELRYGAFAAVARRLGTNRVAVAHTRDDHVETILLHLLRGSGTAGLAGLKARQRLRWDDTELEVLRPLLGVTREQTSGYCRERNLAPRTDPSNRSLALLRNRVRLELLPLLRSYNQAVDGTLLRMAALAGDERQIIEAEAAEAGRRLVTTESGIVRVDSQGFGGLAPAIQRELLRQALALVLGDLMDIESKHIESVRALAGKPVGKRLRLPRGALVATGYGEITLAVGPEEPPFPAIEGEYSLKVPGDTALPGWRVQAEIRGPTSECGEGFVADIDFASAGGQLSVRSRRNGDRFCPLGLPRPKKLQDFMVDARIPRSWRDRIPLVCSPAQVLWVVGWRLDDRVKVSNATRQVLHLEFRRMGQ
ncbi:MAG: tRNA lysidine(34) synthetase TilS [Chloroflexota bacterium]